MSKARDIMNMIPQDEAVDIGNIIKELIKTDIGGDNAEQMKFVQLLKGLATSDDPKSDKFMKQLSKMITKDAFSEF